MIDHHDEGVQGDAGQNEGIEVLVLGHCEHLAAALVLRPFVYPFGMDPDHE